MTESEHKIERELVVTTGRDNQDAPSIEWSRVTVSRNLGILGVDPLWFLPSVFTRVVKTDMPNVPMWLGDDHVGE